VQFNQSFDLLTLLFHYEALSILWPVSLSKLFPNIS